MKTKNTAVQLVYDELKEMIANQELLPGERIIEADIAARAGCSRTPVREAIRLLQEDGLVDMIPNRGSFLKKVTKADVIRGFEVAEALEGMACYLIAERVHNGELTSADFAELEACAKELNHYLEAGLLKKWATADADFHAMLAELCGNHYIVQQRNRITDQINQVLWFVTPFDIDKQVSNQEHMQMLDILQRGDAEAARTIGQLHRHRVRNVLKVIL